MKLKLTAAVIISLLVMLNFFKNDIITGKNFIVTGFHTITAKEGFMDLSSGGHFFRPQNPEGKAQLTIMYVNDVHGDLKRIARFKTAHDSFERENKNTADITAAGGDVLLGSNKTRNGLIVKLMNMIKINYLAPGNHEFDAGSNALSEQLDKAEFTTVATNLNLPEGNSLAEKLKGKQLVRSHVCMKNGTRFAVIGAVPTDADLGMNDKSSKVSPMPIEETVKAMNAEVKELEKQGIDKIILVSHLGYDDQNGDLRIARETEGIDVIVGGHTHTEIEGIQTENKGGTHKKNVVYSKRNEPVVIVQAGGLLEKAGYLDVLFDENGVIIPQKARNILVDLDKFKDSPEIIAETEAALGKNEVIAKINKPFIPAGEYECRNYENPTANLMTDAMKYAGKKQGVQVAMIASPNIRGGIPEELKTYDIKYAMLPFNDEVAVVDLTEKEFVALLNQQALTGVRKQNSQMMQCSGLKYTVDKTISNPDSPDAFCVKNIALTDDNGNIIRKIDASHPDSEKTIRCALNGYVFKDKRLASIMSRTAESRDVIGYQHETFINYVKSLSEINAVREGRITVIE